jgi:hypothetical protein
MMKRLLSVLIVLFSATTARPAPRPDFIPWRENITMVVVPREPQAVQVALDMAKYTPVLPVCYQTTQTKPILHAWNGEGWVPVSMEDYTNGAFFTRPPQYAVIVEPANAPAPECLIPDGTWCKKGARLTSTDRRIMTHLLGLHFDLPYRYWLQLSKRYGTPVERLNPSLKNVIWSSNIPKNPTLFKLDMTHWETLNITPPIPAEPVELIAPEPIEPAEIPAKTPIEKMVDPEPEQPVKVTTMEEIISQLETASQANPQEVNPFSTNDIPAATVILLPAE